MNNYLQLSIDASVLGQHAHVTPVDTKLSDEQLKAVETVIGLFDMTDVIPGDGIGELDTTAQTPGIHFGFINVNGVKLPIRLTLAVVQKA